MWMQRSLSAFVLLRGLGDVRRYADGRASGRGIVAPPPGPEPIVQISRTRLPSTGHMSESTRSLIWAASSGSTSCANGRWKRSVSATWPLVNAREVVQPVEDLDPLHEALDKLHPENRRILILCYGLQGEAVPSLEQVRRDCQHRPARVLSQLRQAEALLL
jgi:hypothetical protein